MKVFISWSGPLSKQIASILKPWLKCMLQATDPFISTEDVEKGSLWFNEIHDQLANTAVGIVCLTRENINAPWILFETGALAKGLTKNRVCTFLIDLPSSELKPPLSQFNATTASQEDMFKLVGTINSLLGENALEAEILTMLFNQFWGSFKPKFDTAIKSQTNAPQPKQRSQSDMLEELLQICRSIQGHIQDETYAPKVLESAVSKSLYKNWLEESPSSQGIDKDKLRRIQEALRKHRQSKESGKQDTDASP